MPLFNPERPQSSSTPAAIGTAAVGTGTTDARDDHVHATGAGTPSTQAFGDAAAVGTGPAAAMTDHKHAMPSQRAAASAAPAAIGTAAVGTGTTDARDDHVHATGAGTPSTQAFGDAAATGTGPAAAMTDHKHAMPAAPTTVANDTLWDAAGDLAVGTGANTAGKLAITVPAVNILNVLGVVNGETTWSVKAVHDGTAPSTQAFGDAAAAGTALTAAHRDHKHAMPANPFVLGTSPSTQAMGDAAAGGAATDAAKTDHKHAMPSLGFGLTSNSTPAVSLTTAEAFITATTSISTATYADITGASIASLAAGTWLILATIVASVITTTAGIVVGAITDSANTVIAEASQSMGAGTASVAQNGTIHLSAIVTPGSTTTYKLRAARGTTTFTSTVVIMNGASLNTANNTTDASNKGTSIRAIRIA